MMTGQHHRKKKTVLPDSFLERLERIAAETTTTRKNRREAQYLVYDAWKMLHAGDAMELLMEAVEIDPLNVDAWLGLLDFAIVDEERMLALLRRVVEMARRNLGEKGFEEYKGHFWGALSTRPYMRARCQLALKLMERGRLDEAITELEGMLELNPNDNQGNRYLLMTCYLAANRCEEARCLFKVYTELACTALWNWAYLLERLLSNDFEDAATALAAARKQNRFAESYFLEKRPLPKTMPDAYSIGSEEEALITWDLMRHAWKRHPTAIEWLQAQQEK